MKTFGFLWMISLFYTKNQWFNVGNFLFFAMHKFCILILNTWLNSVFVNSSYHSSSNSMYLSIACSTHIICIFFPTFYTTFSVSSMLTLCMIYKNLCLIFRPACLPLGNLACRYAPGASKVPIPCPSHASITILVKRSSKYTVGVYILYLYFMYHS